jgi:hypothetical protein
MRRTWAIGAISGMELQRVGSDSIEELSIGPESYSVLSKFIHWASSSASTSGQLPASQYLLDKETKKGLG